MYMKVFLSQKSLTVQNLATFPYVEGMQAPQSISSKAAHRRLRTETSFIHPDLSAFLSQETFVSMTERFLSKVSIEELIGKRESSSETTFSDFKENLMEQIPFLLNIAAQEDKTVFGYHGAPQSFRVFQDVVRIIYEEVLDIPIPADFHFLRVPEELFNYEGQDVKKVFLGNNETQAPDELLPYALDYCILDQINKKYDLSLEPSQFSEAALQEMQSVLSYLRQSMSHKELNPFEIDLTLPQFHCSLLCQEIASLSGLNMDEIYESIAQNLQDFDCNAENLWWYLFEKNRKDFDSAVFVNWFYYFHPLEDTSNEGAKKVVSMVGPLFSGIDKPNKGTCMIPFIENDAYVMDDHLYIREIQQLCIRVGIDPKLGKELYKAGMKVIEETGNDLGVIYQLYDISTDTQATSDAVSYLSENYGLPVYNSENLKTSSFVNGSLNCDFDRQVQIRLIMDNATSLNPNGSIRMVRYDTLPEGTDAAIYAAMRNVLSHTAADSLKVEQYKEMLHQNWAQKV